MASIGLLAVSSIFHRKGLGSALLQSACGWAHGKGATIITVATQAENVPAMKFYESQGFAVISHRPFYHIWLPFSGKIRHNLPYFTGREVRNLRALMATESVESLGFYTKECQQWICDKMGCDVVLLTGSATSALEQAAILCNLQPGDEVIMPSYTFVSTANAVVLRGAIPVFVDVSTTLHIDVSKIEAAISKHTKAIIAVHYAGYPCEMDTIMKIADEHNLLVIEDAAQAFLAKYKDRYLGTIGHFGCFSFHYTKNTICGEGGALLVNDKSCQSRSLVVWEKGTNRFDFINGKVNKYEWVDIGSSFVPSEINSAFLMAQLEEAEECAARRSHIVNMYRKFLQPLEAKVSLMPEIDKATGNGHIFWLTLSTIEDRECFQKWMLENEIECYTHYLPLHSSPGGKKYAKGVGDMSMTAIASSRLVRLPVWVEMNFTHVHRVIDSVFKFFNLPAPSLKQVMVQFLESDFE